jgi:hypothetical protein
VTEEQTEAQAQELRISKLAIASLLLAVPVLAVSIFVFFEPTLLFYTPCCAVLPFLVLAFLSLLSGFTALARIGRSQAKQKGTALALAGIAAVGGQKFRQAIVKMVR